jgi:hypothetical protein
MRSIKLLNQTFKVPLNLTFKGLLRQTLLSQTFRAVLFSVVTVFVSVCAEAAATTEADGMREICGDSTICNYADSITTTAEALHHGGRPLTIYAQPLSFDRSDPWWHGLWINTAVYSGAFIATLFVLECLPENATAWNRAELQQDPFYKRWFNNIFKRGPEWDHDKFIFNYVLHPYAGAAYFMSARTCGFNIWQSMLYSACISTIGWEFGIEACMERPSYQDLLITPIFGSVMGEGFYRLKRLIVDRNYYLLGSPIIGHICAFFLDPVNELLGLFSSKYACRNLGPGSIVSQHLLRPTSGAASPAFGFTITATF